MSLFNDKFRKLDAEIAKIYTQSLIDELDSNRVLAFLKIKGKANVIEISKEMGIEKKRVKSLATRLLIENKIKQSDASFVPSNVGAP